MGEIRPRYCARTIQAPAGGRGFSSVRRIWKADKSALRGGASAVAHVPGGSVFIVKASGLVLVSGGCGGFAFSVSMFAFAFGTFGCASSLFSFAVVGHSLGFGGSAFAFSC